MTEKFDFTEGVQFDPGFICNLNAFVPSIDYIYSDLNRLRNFNQKKLKFKMYYHKILNLIDNYIGFYLGCILWAACINDLDKPILNNLCFGADYEEKETIGEVQFVREYLAQFVKDVKYYLGQDYQINDLQTKILDEYEEFLKLNKGFTTLKNANDLVLNKGVKTLKDTEKELILEKIAGVVESGNFKEFYPLNEKLFAQKAAV